MTTITTPRRIADPTVSIELCRYDCGGSPRAFTIEKLASGLSIVSPPFDVPRPKRLVRMDELKDAMGRHDKAADPEGYKALQDEYRRLLTRRTA